MLDSDCDAAVVKWRRLATLAMLLLLSLLESRCCAGDALQRLALQRLKAVQQDVESLKQQRQPVALQSRLQDYRCALHVHSHLSHDSHGTIPEKDGRSVEFPAMSSGIYRVEVWLQLGGEARIWVLSNPVYIRD